MTFGDRWHDEAMRWRQAASTSAVKGTYRRPPGGEMPAVDPVVDDIRLDAQPMGNLGHAQLALATGGSIEIWPDVW